MFAFSAGSVTKSQPHSSGANQSTSAGSVSGFGIYRLPQFKSVVDKLLTGCGQESVCRATRGRILQILYDDLLGRVGL